MCAGRVGSVAHPAPLYLSTADQNETQMKPHRAAGRNFDPKPTEIQLRGYFPIFPVQTRPCTRPNKTQEQLVWFVNSTKTLRMGSSSQSTNTSVGVGNAGSSQSGSLGTKRLHGDSERKKGLEQWCQLCTFPPRFQCWDCFIPSA